MIPRAGAAYNPEFTLSRMTTYEIQHAWVSFFTGILDRTLALHGPAADPITAVAPIIATNETPAADP